MHGKIIVLSRDKDVKEAYTVSDFECGEFAWFTNRYADYVSSKVDLELNVHAFLETLKSCGYKTDEQEKMFIASADARLKYFEDKHKAIKKHARELSKLTLEQYLNVGDSEVSCINWYHNDECGYWVIYDDLMTLDEFVRTGLTGTFYITDVFDYHY